MWRLNRGTGGAPIKSMDDPLPVSFAAKKLQKMLFAAHAIRRILGRCSIRIDCSL